MKRRRARRGHLMDERRHPGFRGMFGGGLQHVTTGPDGRWLALPGWCAEAFKVGARDAWIGWATEQQFRRLPLAANNCRFPLPAEDRVPNLASRVPALSTRRLPGDMQERFGYPALLARIIHEIHEGGIAGFLFLMRAFLASFTEPPRELLLDLDATGGRVHGKQEGRFSHGCCDSHCFLPLALSAATGCRRRIRARRTATARTMRPRS